MAFSHSPTAFSLSSRAFSRVSSSALRCASCASAAGSCFWQAQIIATQISIEKASVLFISGRNYKFHRCDRQQLRFVHDHFRRWLTHFERRAHLLDLCGCSFTIAVLTGGIAANPNVERIKEKPPLQ